MSDRIAEIEAQIEKKKQLLKIEKQKLKEQERKARTHRLIEVGAMVENALGRPIAENEKESLQVWLIDQKDWLEKALKKTTKK